MTTVVYVLCPSQQNDPNGIVLFCIFRSLPRKPAAGLQPEMTDSKDFRCTVSLSN